VSTELVEPIPWDYTDSPGILLWTWLTEHFVARITGTEVANDEDPDGRRIIRAYAWDLSDLMKTNQGLPRLLVEGISESFEDAERSIRENVGKCYDPRLNYRKYAGALAFTFTLSTGEVVDVSQFIGPNCSVTVLMPDRSERTVRGELDVVHYKWHLRTSDQILEILPEHVLRVTNRSETAERATAVVKGDLYSGVGRIYKQDPRPGCTGRAGFMVGTVDHAGAPRCPIHEIGVPEHLLR
jgi:hypothetical protein